MRSIKPWIINVFEVEHESIELLPYSEKTLLSASMADFIRKVLNETRKGEEERSRSGLSSELMVHDLHRLWHIHVEGTHDLVQSKS